MNNKDDTIKRFAEYRKQLEIEHQKNQNIVKEREEKQKAYEQEKKKQEMEAKRLEDQKKIDEEIRRQEAEKQRQLEIQRQNEIAQRQKAELERKQKEIKERQFKELQDVIRTNQQEFQKIENENNELRKQISQMNLSEKEKFAASQKAELINAAKTSINQHQNNYLTAMNTMHNSGNTDKDLAKELASKKREIFEELLKNIYDIDQDLHKSSSYSQSDASSILEDGEKNNLTQVFINELIESKLLRVEESGPISKFVLNLKSEIVQELANPESVISIKNAMEELVYSQKPCKIHCILQALVSAGDAELNFETPSQNNIDHEDKTGTCITHQTSFTFTIDPENHRIANIRLSK